MRIIFLEGESGSGKTTTLQMVYAALKLLNAAVLCSPLHIENSSKRDFKAKLSFQNKTVVIFTKGDIQTDCIKAIQECEGEEVDVLIMAHTSNLMPLTGTPVTAPHTTVTVQKTVPPNKFEEISTHIGDCLNVIINI
jgi:ABC-type proline/glycine betaine transport system ATPase subunit